MTNWINSLNYIDGRWLPAKSGDELESLLPTRENLSPLSLVPRLLMSRQPVVALIEVGEFEEAIAILNDTPYGLSSSVYTGNINRAFIAMHDIEAGITYINGPTISPEVHLPFGGLLWMYLLNGRVFMWISPVVCNAPRLITTE